MSDQVMIQYCEEHKDNCIVLLKTPRAGEKVDNGVGVDFEITPYFVICHDRDKIDIKIEEKDRWNLIHNFEIENCKSLQGMIDTLKKTDGYEVIWRNAEYKEPSKMKSELTIGAGKIECELKIEGSIKILYSDLSKYFEERVNPSNWQHDVFHKALEDYNDQKDMVGCRFLGDATHLTNIMYFKDHVEFEFVMTSKESFNFDEKVSPKFLPVNSTVDKRSMFCNLVKALELKVTELTK